MPHSEFNEANCYKHFFHFKRFTKEEEQLMRQFFTKIFVVALIFALAIPVMAREPGDPDASVIALRVFGIDADCKIAIFQNGGYMVYDYAEVPGSVEQLFYVPDTGDDYTVCLLKDGFYSIDANAVRMTYQGVDEFRVSFDCFYQIEVPVGVTNVWISSWDWCVRNANEGDTIDLIADWNNIRNARLEYDFGGTRSTMNFKLDGSDPFAGNVSVNFPGVEDVTIQYCTGGKWFNCPGTFNYQTGFITVPTGSTAIRAVKGAMSYQFDGLNIGGLNVFDVPTITLSVFGLDANCKIGVFQNGWDMVYDYAGVSGGVPKLFQVFDTGWDYTVRLSKTGFYSIDANAVRTTYQGVDELRASFDCFYQIEVPVGVTNVSIASWDWCVRNANAGDMIDLVADWNNIRTARLDFDFGGKSNSLIFKLDGSDPFVGKAFVNFPGVEGVTIQYCTGGTWFNYPGTFNHQTGFITLPQGSTTIRAVKGAMSYQFDGVNIGFASNTFNVPVIVLNVSGIDANCKIGVLLNGWDTVYGNADVPGDGQKNYYVFDTGENYTVRLSKTGFYSIDANAVRTTYQGVDELRASFDCFYQIEVPVGVTNVSIASWDWCIRNANAGDTIDLVADWNNIRYARLDYDFEGKSNSLIFKLDGSNPFVGMVVKVVPSAILTQLNGNKNDLTISVEETYANGSTATTSGTFLVANNSAATYTVGNYRIYVDAKNNGQIRECYIVK